MTAMVVHGWVGGGSRNPAGSTLRSTVALLLPESLADFL
jgi:hypothetical protein